jgi:phage tail-like protein
VGRVKLQPLVLKRGMVIKRPPAETGGPAKARPELWAWIQDTVVGRLPIRRYDGLVEVTGPADPNRPPVPPPTLASWRFVRGLPLKVTGPTLNAKTGEVAIEELHIAHEGLHLVTDVDK